MYGLIVDKGNGSANKLQGYSQKGKIILIWNSLNWVCKVWSNIPPLSQYRIEK